MDYVSFASPFPPLPLQFRHFKPSPLLLRRPLVARAAATSESALSYASTMLLFDPRRRYMLRSSGGTWFLPNPVRRWKAPGFPSIRASKHGGGEPDIAADGRVLAGSAFAVLFAVMNRVLYKLALVPMKQYPFFLAQITTFGYVAVYFFILYVRYRANIVTKEMLALPKSPFVAIGFLEALGVASGMSAGAMLPGPAIPILSQSFLVWQLVFSVLILERKYSFNQIFGCLLVTFGLVLAVASGANEGQFLSEVEFIWPLLMVASSAFQAAASILKEFVFADGAKRLQGKPPDIFVVNSFGSGFQALFVFLLLPFLSKLRGIPFSQLPSYLSNGAACFLNIGGHMAGSVMKSKLHI